MAQVAIFKQIFDKVRNNLNYHWFYSELKRHNVSHYIYYLATENIHLVLENDNTVLIKGQSKVVNVRFSKNKCLIEATLKGFKSGELSFYEYRKNLATAGVFRWITNIHENKRYYYTFDNSLLFTENIQKHYTNISALNHNVRFLPCQNRTRWHDEICVPGNPGVHRY